MAAPDMSNAANNVQVLIAVVAGLSAVLGALIGTVGTLVATWISKRSEERRHSHEQVMRAAVEYWIKNHEMALKHAGGKTIAIIPLESYVVHIAAMTALLNEKKLTPERAAQIIRETHAISKAAEAEIRAQQ